MKSYPIRLWRRLSQLGVKSGDPHSSRSREIPLQAVGSSIFVSFFHDNFRPEVVSDVISSFAVARVGVDVPVKFGDCRSNRSRYIRTTHFVMDERRRPTPLRKLLRIDAVIN